MSAVARASVTRPAALLVTGRVIGLIAVHSYTFYAYTDADLALFHGVAHQAAIAINNARLHSALQQELREAGVTAQLVWASGSRVRAVAAGDAAWSRSIGQVEATRTVPERIAMRFPCSPLTARTS